MPEAQGGTHSAREAGGSLCNRSHVRAFVYTTGTRVTSGNANMQIKGYYITFDTCQKKTKKLHKPEWLGKESHKHRQKRAKT